MGLVGFVIRRVKDRLKRCFAAELREICRYVEDFIFGVFHESKDKILVWPLA